MKAPAVNKIFRAFADETRLRILYLLSCRELCVCDLVAALKAPQSKISRHLGYLRDAGLVADRKDGTWRYYSLKKPEGRFHSGLVGCLDKCFDEVPILQKDAQRLGGIRDRRC